MQHHPQRSHRHRRSFLPNSLGIYHQSIDYPTALKPTLRKNLRPGQRFSASMSVKRKKPKIEMLIMHVETRAWNKCSSFFVTETFLDIFQKNVSRAHGPVPSGPRTSDDLTLVLVGQTRIPKALNRRLPQKKLRLLTF